MVYYIPKETMNESINWKKIKGVFFAAIALISLTGGALYVFRQKADDFQQVTDENVERLHGEIRAGRYREILFANDRRLILNQDEAELTAMFRQANHFLAQNPRVHCLPPYFEDTAQRVSQRFGRPFEIAGSCLLTTAAGAAATELFVWRNSGGGGLKLTYYELSAR